MKKEETIRSLSGSKVALRYLCGETVQTVRGTVVEVCVPVETVPFIIVECKKHDLFISMLTLIDIKIISPNKIEIQDNDVDKFYR